MKKQQKLSALKEAITASRIHQAIDVLQKSLYEYERSKGVLNQRYQVKQAMGETRRLLLELENQLEELAVKSKHWEAPE